MNLNSIIIFLTVLQTIPVIANFTRPAEGFTAEGIKGILDKLNRIRSKLALGNFTSNGNSCASATRMLKVKWDPEVAAIAQDYVNTWNGSNENQLIPSKGYHGLVEVQYYAVAYDDDRWNNDEYQLLGVIAIVHYGFDKYLIDGFTNHLKNFGDAQLIMDNISGVGCGIVEKTGRIENGTLRPYVCALVLCYFTPRQFVYKEGKTCSECPAGTQCVDSTGLCEDIEKETPPVSSFFGRSEGGFNAEGIKAIVDTVNKYRSQIALGNVSVNGAFWPSATNMMKVKWDPELAAIARLDSTIKAPESKSREHPGLVAAQVKWDLHRSFTNPEYQQLGATMLEGAYLAPIIGISYSNQFSIFTYAQLVNAETSGVGCGIFETVYSPTSGNYKLTCYVAPHQFIYKEGKTCSECPVGTKCEESTGLCEDDPSSSDVTKNISFGVYLLYFLKFYRIHLL